MDKKEAITILEELINRIDSLMTMERRNPDFEEWRRDVTAAIKHIFEDDSGYVRDFQKISFSLFASSSTTRESEFQRAYTRGLQDSKTFIQSMIDEIEIFWTEPEVTESISPAPSGESVDKSSIFVIHGRNITLRDSMFEFLRSIKLNPIEWSQAIALTGKGTPTITEILDTAFNNAQALLVLITGDDEVRLRSDLHQKDEPDQEKEPALQASPNVIFEAGMAIGRNSDRTIMVQIGELKPWCDILGKHITYLDNSVEKRNELVTKLRNAGCPVDTSGDNWLETGDFE